jgi:hypothetical protein
MPDLLSRHICSQGTWPYMSANLLEYPRKPNELADDLESVVYVVSEGFLRFHPHNLSGPSTSALQPPASSEQSNQPPPANNKLARYVATTFYEADVVGSGYVVGGQRKRAEIDAGRPGFKLSGGSSNQETETQVFLRELYELLREHYAATPQGIYERFRAPSQANENHTLESANTKMAMKVDDDQELLEAFFESHATATPASQLEPGREPEPVSVAQRKLDTHDAIMQIFLRYLMDRTTRTARKHIHYQKTKDQFEGLPRNVNVTSVGASSGSVTHSRSKIWSVQLDVPTLDLTAEKDASKQDVFVAEEDIIDGLSHLSI